MPVRKTWPIRKAWGYVLLIPGIALLLVQFVALFHQTATSSYFAIAVGLPGVALAVAGALLLVQRRSTIATDG